VLVSGAIVMEIPMVHKVEKIFYDTVKSGDIINLDATNGMIHLKT
jgi:predicted aconitase with swiveling domain